MSINLLGAGPEFTRIGEAIDFIGTDRSYDAAFQLMKMNLAFEMVSIVAYRGKTRPVLLFDTFGDTPYREGLTNYVEYSYVLSPCYQAYLDGISPGVYRMKDLVSEEYPISKTFKSVPAAWSEKEEMRYITRGWPEQREELLLLVELSEGDMAEMSFLRPNSSSGFEAREVSNLEMAAPFLSAITRANWARFAREAKPADDSTVNVAFESFGKDLLSLREAEVVRLILQGHSSVSISLRLNIAITTVKSHRKNAYAKLHIATQSELMALYVRWLEDSSRV
ncbi:LuxR family transcriptional regulator [Burkholderia cenocepacia]|uniref:response regulator transcription factor n=1 Tax=Burkholderia cenocepacia TaxID=95486 RepID=UPI000F59E392|nr:helix-turn-helix transcriptional regulator [Burkholderia cenocepacia]RQT95236.1 LuxR family transcriptional regulator [Burkholderia cenocepacia]RQU51393.1 LuxR family transcriptional regulator [Burkholderia cenocepacia]